MGREKRQEAVALPQAERSAISTRRILDATVRSLFDHGYGATSVSAVVDGAGLSRGAFLHHFPSKAELMLAVIRRTWCEDRAIFLEWFGQVTDLEERFVQFVEPGWRALSRPAGVAVLEILIACRSDLVLADAVAPVQAEIRLEAKGLLYENIAGPLGLPDERSAIFFRFAEAAVRGLVTDLMTSRDNAAIGPTLDCIKLVARDILAKRNP